MYKSSMLGLTISALILLCSPQALAAIIKIEAEAEIESIDDGLIGNSFFSLGDSVFLTFTYDDQAPLNPVFGGTSNVSSYEAIRNWSLRYGSFNAVDSNGSIFLTDRQPLDEFGDRIDFGGALNLSNNGPVSGFTYNNSSFAIGSADPDLFDGAEGDELAGLTLDPMDFNIGFITIAFAEQIDINTTMFHNSFARIDLDSFTFTVLDDVSDVPLPAAPLLLFSGLVMLWRKINLPTK